MHNQQLFPHNHYISSTYENILLETKFCQLRAPTFVILHDLRISTLYSHFDVFYDFSYSIINSYIRTITILVQDMEKFHSKQSFATLGGPHLLYYMTFVFQLYIVILMVFMIFLSAKSTVISSQSLYYFKIWKNSTNIQVLQP